MGIASDMLHAVTLAGTLREAQTRSEEIIREAEVYALEQLQQLEAHLSRTLATVKRGVETLQPRGETQTLPPGSPSEESA